MGSDLWIRLRALFRRNAVEGELERELRFHFERQVEKYAQAGLPPEDARRRARLAFGGEEQVKEECREARGVRLLETLWQDIHYGLRMLGKNPGFTAVAVLTLALGIGANSAIFSVVNAVLVRGLPFRDPAQLVALFQSPEKSKGPMGWAAAGPDVVDWRRESRTLAAIAASLEDGANLVGAGAPEHVRGQKVSANYFDLLGAPAALGRTFLPAEDEPGSEQEVVLSYGLWQRGFGGGNVLGQTIQLDSQAFTVIGVMPATYRDPRTWMNPTSEYWIPLPRMQLEANRGEHMYAVFGRLRPGATLAQAQQEMEAIGRREARQFPATDAGLGVRVSPLEQVNLETFEEGRFQSVAPAILLVQFAAGFLLLLACANVAHLILARQVNRQRELALRAALGAERWRLVRQVLTESVLLAVLSGAAGILLAIWCKRVLVGLAPEGYLPPTAAIGLDLRVLGFTLAIATLSGLLFGSFPAARAARRNLSEELKGAGTGTARSSSMPRVRQALLVTELAATFLLLAGGGLMARSLASLLRVDPGFQPRDFFTAQVTLPSQGYAKPEQILRFYQAAQSRVARVPGIEAAAFTSAPEFAVTDSSNIAIEGQAPKKNGLAEVWPQICFVTPQFFRAAGIPLLRGRDFDAADSSSNRKIAIISEAFAAHFWPGQNPVGKRLSWGDGGWREVVGLAGDVRQQGLAAASLPELYLPLTRETADGETAMSIVVRSAGPPAALASEIERQIWPVASQVPLSEVRTGSQILEVWAGYLRYRTVLLASFALMALAIAMTGVFGAMAYAAAQRSQEIGIRVALGAQRSDVLRLVLAQGAKLVLAGLAIGAAGALALTRVMADLLYGVTPSDPLTFASAAALLAFVALAACAIPARRAMRVDPMAALRHE